MDLSVVVPLFNEQAVVDELVKRCRAALDQVPGTCELIVVNDASDDGTRAALDRLCETTQGLRALHLGSNQGQFQATCEGIRAARGTQIVVLDGDLQDPPELIPTLAAAWADAPESLDAVFAVKTERDDPAWQRAGAKVYATVLRALGGRVPPGAGSYCLMRADVARAVTAIRVRDMNLAAALAAQGVRCTTVGYTKAARRDGSSRVGPWGLVREALGSLFARSAMVRSHR